jgi:hypothetical protein
MNCALDNYDLRTQALPYIVCLEGSSHDWNIEYFMANLVGDSVPNNLVWIGIRSQSVLIVWKEGKACSKLGW